VLYGLRNEIDLCACAILQCGGNRRRTEKPIIKNCRFHRCHDRYAYFRVLSGNSTTIIFPVFLKRKCRSAFQRGERCTIRWYTALADVVKAWTILLKAIIGGGYTIRKRAGSQFARIMTWSINWDNTNNYNFGKTCSTYFGVSAGVHESLRKTKGQGLCKSAIEKWRPNNQ